MEKILSIIIPTYNMEKYLRYCLDSLLIRNNFDRLEVLVINDGSKDSSSVIAHEYETQFPNVFKVIDKENGNYGSCINKGLSIATGKYVKVLDADDGFDTKNFEDFVSYLMSVDADLVLSDFVIVDENRHITSHREFGFPTKGLLSMSDICTTDSFKDMQMHAVTYRRQNLIDLGYKQTEGISYTDQEWIFLPMMRVQTIYYHNKYVYKYLVGRSGQTMDEKVRLKSLNDLMRCLISMVKVYNRHAALVQSYTKEYMLTRLIPQIKYVYITTFANYSKPLRQQLVNFDDALSKEDQSLYSLVERTKSPVNYIAFWRRHKDISPSLLRIATNMYLRMKN